MTNPSAQKMEHWLIFQNDRLLIPNDESGKFMLTSALIADIKPALKHQLSLGQIDQFNMYCGELLAEHPLPPSLISVSLRKALEMVGIDWYNMAAKAYAIINWDKNHQYCGRCSNITAPKPGVFERICTVCSLAFYPRISPSVIVRINKGDQIMMARSPHFTPGAYGLIAGFVEAGESLENAVHREVREEIGIKIKNLRYYGSQPWPFPDSLMVAYTAEYESGDLVIDSNELEAAGWYRFDNLPGRPSYRISLSSQLIDDFIAQHRGT